MKAFAVLVFPVLLAAGVATGAAVLPNGWIVAAPPGAMVRTGTMPQGAAISADASTLAVVESGFNPPALTLYAVGDLHAVRRISLTGAFGRPVWRGTHVLVAGANADAVFDVDTRSGVVKKFAVAPNSYPVAIAVRGETIAVATANDGCVRVAALAGLSGARPIAVGSRPGNLAFSSDGRRVFVAVRAASYVAAVDVGSERVTHIATGLHPADVLVTAGRLYVAESDADSVGIFEPASGKRIGDVFVGTMHGSIGSSPNSLSAHDGSIFVTLGAANEIAVLRGDRVANRLPSGWYPTAAVPAGNDLLVVDGKGESARANPGFDMMADSAYDYVASIEYGSIRRVPLAGATANPQGQSGYGAASPAGTIVRKNGPIRHVFFILKENRTYDQILGDMPQGDGDKRLTWFGRRVTPNQHLLALRFGLFDNCYASGEVSDAGHNWADAAFVNDYAERLWPVAYGGRFDGDDALAGAGAATPAKGYIWDAARAAHVSFRDYGELALFPALDGHPATTAPTLGNRFDPHYVGWSLEYSDLDRVKEWKREFDHLVATDAVPQLEWIWLPNDHTYGSRAGKLTPTAYIATNDYAVGSIVQTISHSKIWGSSAIFITEDDAQDGADHVSDQRTTLFVVSPYARGGTIHAHVSTVGVVRTIELLTGMAPMSNYDRSAVPLYDAFVATPNLTPYDAVVPRVDFKAKNAKTAYGERRSELADFSRPDAVPPRVLTDILAHNH